MGEKALVDSQLNDAYLLIQKLDADGNSPTLAMWYFYDDVEEWRLIIAGPKFDALLPKQEALAYKILVEAIASISLSSISASYLKLVKTDSPMPLAIHALFITGPTSINQAHFVNTTLNGIFIKEMLILRSA